MTVAGWIALGAFALWEVCFFGFVLRLWIENSKRREELTRLLESLERVDARAQGRRLVSTSDAPTFRRALPPRPFGLPRKKSPAQEKADDPRNR